MYKVLQFRLRDFVFLRRSRHVYVKAGVRRDAETEKTWRHEHINTQTLRLYSSRGARRDVVEMRRQGVPGRYTSTVDPTREEDFVFLDYAEQQEENPEELLLKDLQISSPSVLKSPARSSAEKQPRALERQLKSLKSVTKEEVDPDSFIQFHDIDFPLDESITKSMRKKMRKGEQKIYGTPDIEEPVSNTCCSGCGAVLHCTAPDIAGYLPSEKYKVLLLEDQLKNAICQRCYLLIHHQKALTVKMSKEEYRDVVRGIRSHKALVLLIVDLLDIPDSIVSDLLGLVGKNKHIVVLGNKIDLLPRDSPNYLHRINRQLSQYCTDAGIGDNVKDIHLISAKTGYGIENLISSLQKSWKYKGDVYLVGTANAGKSTLFNTLLDSDYCKSKATDVIHKATISPWPGTTLNLLKFPIINPTPYRMFRRMERLNDASAQTEGDLSPDELKRLQHFSKQGYLVGRVGRTFRIDAGSQRDVIEFDPDSLAYGEYQPGDEVKEDSSPSTETEFTLNELKDAHWLFDTPGIMKEHDILGFLSEKEVKMVVPTQAIVPRTFVLKPGMVLFLGALGRIDYLQGEKSCWFSVVASDRLPVHITSLDKADAIYQKHAGHTLLGVPTGGEERMKDFPPLVSQDFRLEGKGYLQASADIKLSSAGWVSVTGVEGDQLVLRAHAPEAAGMCLRSPPLLPHIVTLKGQRIKKSSAYKPMKPPALVDTTLSAKGAERLKVQKSKTKKKK
ncbi:nitric oxide-associated protein 1 [Polymixia lowei]